MKYYVLIICLFSSVSLYAKLREIPVKLSLATMFAPDISYTTGIKGNVNAGGKIDVKIVDKQTGTLLFQCTLNQSSSEFAGSGQTYSKESLGSGAIYYPDFWNSLDLKKALFAIDRKHYDLQAMKPYKFLSSELELILKIEEVNAQMDEFKFPGVGIVDQFGGNSLFHPNHFCHDLMNTSSFVTKVWTKIKTPDINKGSDLIIAAHRGVWGDKLGAGAPENSIAAIKRTKDFTDILESDIMITKDKQLIVSHDYCLMRLTDYSGSPRDYLFNMNQSQLVDLHLRRRNMSVSDFKLLTFGGLVDALIENQLVLTIDIKEIIARRKDGVCIDNCASSP
ncbi:glycerophosphodiester phosphodiesterase family protein [Bacteroides eggerthii]|uniref:glycerophosphodiester phosphodiesterase family protein n=1 Tax=Bacteroides eggerthii TaxID=28111 RepID=UPI0020CACA3F|nr:glycerophosphodiester phosphodiesterase family protein [Bacteroides eggerthii]